jgi:hypothetical protein
MVRQNVMAAYLTVTGKQGMAEREERVRDKIQFPRTHPQ